MDSSAFERLCILLLRKSGFKKVDPTKSGGDGGIDGMGILQINLISFTVGLQCKCYRENNKVKPRDIRDFRDAIQGRADKGIFITTSSFTREARKEAQAVGKSNIDLIEGDELCEKLKELRIGIETKIESIEKVTISHQFFIDI